MILFTFSSPFLWAFWATPIFDLTNLWFQDKASETVLNPRVNGPWAPPRAGRGARLCRFGGCPTTARCEEAKLHPSKELFARSQPSPPTHSPSPLSRPFLRAIDSASTKGVAHSSVFSTSVMRKPDVPSGPSLLRSPPTCWSLRPCPHPPFFYS